MLQTGLAGPASPPPAPFTATLRKNAQRTVMNDGLPEFCRKIRSKAIPVRRGAADAGLS